MTKYCKICGAPFECLHGSGAYCSDACRKVGVMISRQRYNTKSKIEQSTKVENKTKDMKQYNHEYYINVKKPQRQAKKLEMQAQQNEGEKIATKIVRNPVVTTTIINHDGDIVITELEKSINDNLELLDAVRDELQKIVDDLKARQSAYDQKDIENLHLLEGATSDASLLQYAKKCNADRKNRRNYKNYITYLISLLRGIPTNTKDAFEKSKQVQQNKNTFYAIKY